VSYNQLWEGVKQGVDALGDFIVSTIGSWMDRGWAAMLEKGGEMMGGLSASISNGIASAKAGISDMVSPNAIGRGKSDPSPSVERSPSPAPQHSVDRGRDFGEMLQASGFSMESLDGLGVQASDLGNVSVGVGDVGCAAYNAPRTLATNSFYR